MKNGSIKNSVISLLFIAALSLFVSVGLANTYVMDIGFVTSKTVYTVNESIELRGHLYLSNYTDEGSLLSNATGLAGARINVSILYTSNNLTASTYSINTTSGGLFYSRSDFYSNATLIKISVPGNYYIRAGYTDSSGALWWTQAEIQVVSQAVDRLYVSTDKVSYDPGEAMVVTVEAITEIGDRISYTANVSINGTIRNSTKDVLGNFSCVTGDNGKCEVATTSPSDYGNYIVEVNNFKVFSSFEVIRFSVNIAMKDELGKSIKHVFAAGEQASVEVSVLTNSTSETYTFTGTVTSSSGEQVKTITSTTLNYTNSYTNRFTFSLDAINFQVGSYAVDVTVAKSGDGSVSASTAFEVRSWDLTMNKKDVGSGFEYEYSTFPNRTVLLEIYPTWRGNGSVITGINATTSMNISIVDRMSNQYATANAAWNSTCGTDGCYDFSIQVPGVAGEYYITTSISCSGSVQSVRKKIGVISASIFAQSTDKDGSLKDLFNAADLAYISLSAKNSTSDINLSEATVVSVTYMNGSDYTYVQVADFDSVNSTNDVMEWAWNSTQQRIKLDTPKAGGIYIVSIVAENSTAAASTKFIVNPYDVCIVAKNTAGRVGNAYGSGYYYVYQFKTGDTVYFELKIVQASNPLGRASFNNNTGGNGSYGMGSACADLSATRQMINNASITIEQVVNMQSGKIFTLNSTASVCQSDDNKGAYTCTLKSLTNWDGGSYGVKFNVIGSDGQSDTVFGGFEAKAFYLYAWTNNWWNKPDSSIALVVNMYEAGTNWWGSYGSGGLSGTVKLEKVEYQGREGEWLWPPVDSSYNASLVNTSAITNGQGTLTLNVNYTPGQVWKTGYYRAVLKGTDNGGNSDYGYAWFSVRRWEVYASPISCAAGTDTCTSAYNINSKSNISMYVTINNAGQWGQGGNNLGGNVVISVKKIMDCRRWPCTDLNYSMYTATNITVQKSSGWYWSGDVNRSYIINITPVSGTWGTGYWQMVLDVNGSETGSGWFNTIAFYAEAQPTNSTGDGWKYNIRNAEPMFFKLTSTRSQKGGYNYGSYTEEDYINTTISSAFLRWWNQDTQQSVEYKYPEDFTIGILDGGSIINGSRIINVTRVGGPWPSAYYWGELTLSNSENETATSYLWFQVMPFRVDTSSSRYEIDDNVCVNGTIIVYDPDWSKSLVMTDNYTITNVTETIWSNYGSTIVSYTNYTPTSSFNGSANFTVCPSGNLWDTGNGGYHYLTVKVSDIEGNSQNGWLSFRATMFKPNWGSVIGGTSVINNDNVVVPVNLTKPISGALARGNLSRIYQWRCDAQCSMENYVFSVGNCYSNVSGRCMINETQNITIYAPANGWRTGSNYLTTVWTAYNDSSKVAEDWSSLWFNGVEVYSGWFTASGENGNYKYDFSVNENLSIRLYVRDSSNSPARVNVSAVQYATPTESCNDQYCLIYHDVSFSIVGQSNNEIDDNGIIRIIKLASNWEKGNIYIKATVTGPGGLATIRNGMARVKDFTPPNVTITVPQINDTINGTSFWINWTTTESATCYMTIYNYDMFHEWYCSGWNNTNSTNASSQIINTCNMTKYGFNGSYYMIQYTTQDYYSWYNGTYQDYYSGLTGMSTGGTSHYYRQYTNHMLSQDYAVSVQCNDVDWNYGSAYAGFRVNLSSDRYRISTSLLSPGNGATISGTGAPFNFTFSEAVYANCTLYGNFTGDWQPRANRYAAPSGIVSTFAFNLTSGNYAWNVYCADITNSTNDDWGDANWTFVVS